jgi:4-amino-4-deoxy-L-arabinose transferase-like glycosyltransferase
MDLAILNRFQNINVRKILFAILLLALIVRIGFIVTLDEKLVWYDAQNYHSIATNLAEGEGFQSSFNPYSTRSWAPLYPYFMGSLYWLFGSKILVVRLAQVLLGVLLCLVVFYITREILNDKIALLTGLIMAVHPLFIYTSGVFYPVIIFSLLLALVVLLLAKFMKKPTNKKWLIILISVGFLLGLLMLTKPVIIFIFPFIPLWFLIDKRVSFIQAVKYSFIIFFIAGLTIVPWTVRNYLEYDEFYFITAEGGHSFYGANVPWFNMDRSQGYEIPEDIKKKMEGLSEQEKNEILEQEALNFIKKSPFQFISLYTKKFVNFWRFYPKTISQNKFTNNKNTIVSLLFYGFIIPLAFVGMIALVREWKQYYILYATIFSFDFGYSFFGTTLRYRLPVDPYIVIFSAVGIAVVLNFVYVKMIDNRNANLQTNK